MQRRLPPSRLPNPESFTLYHSTEISAVLEEPLLVSWDSLPSFLQDNEYIRSGYRPQSNSYRKCIVSLKYIHNQTGNIYTSGFGALAFFFSGKALFHNIESRFPAATQQDIIVFEIFFLGIISCLSMSFINHTCMNHSPEALETLMNFDFSGILFAAFGGFVPGLWYTFYCLSSQTKIWLIMVCFSQRCGNVN